MPQSFSNSSPSPTTSSVIVSLKSFKHNSVLLKYEYQASFSYPQSRLRTERSKSRTVQSRQDTQQRLSEREVSDRKVRIANPDRSRDLSYKDIRSVRFEDRARAVKLLRRCSYQARWPRSLKAVQFCGPFPPVYRYKLLHDLVRSMGATILPSTYSDCRKSMYDQMHHLSSSLAPLYMTSICFTFLQLATSTSGAVFLMTCSAHISSSLPISRITELYADNALHEIRFHIRL